MPRLPTSLLRNARSIDPFLPLLLRPCRDLPSARNELRWLREHVAAPPKNPHHDISSPAQLLSQASTLHELCLARSRGKPLQYILGSQPFGELEILCRKGVLIPRPETETFTHHLAHILSDSLSLDSPARPLRILDLCTGTGCIPLLLHSLLSASKPTVPNLEILGVDISPTALSLANENLEHNITLGNLSPRARHEVRFTRGDVLNWEEGMKTWNWTGMGGWDIVTANPPYISPAGFARETEGSVRGWEPRLALVPPLGGKGGGGGNEGDTFYPALLSLARFVGANILLMEVGGTAQAGRVVEMARDTEGGEKGWQGVEVWCDELGGRGFASEDSRERGEAVSREDIKGTTRDGKKIPVRQVGTGHARAVVCFRGVGAEWLGAGKRRP